MGNGIGSLVFAALELGHTFWLISLVGFQTILILPILAGVGLLAAGVMAIMARADYLDWKKSQKPGTSDNYFNKRKPKRNREDNEDED
jgi:hypothetical protein